MCALLQTADHCAIVAISGYHQISFSMAWLAALDRSRMTQVKAAAVICSLWVKKRHPLLSVRYLLCPTKPALIDRPPPNFGFGPRADIRVTALLLHRIQSEPRRAPAPSPRVRGEGRDEGACRLGSDSRPSPLTRSLRSRPLPAQRGEDMKMRCRHAQLTSSPHTARSAARHRVRSRRRAADCRCAGRAHRDSRNRCANCAKSPARRLTCRRRSP